MLSVDYEITIPQLIFHKYFCKLGSKKFFLQIVKQLTIQPCKPYLTEAGIILLSRDGALTADKSYNLYNRPIDNRERFSKPT